MELWTAITLVCWCLWTHHNGVVFDGISPSPETVIDNIVTEAEQWSAARLFRGNLALVDRWRFSDAYVDRVVTQPLGCFFYKTDTSFQDVSLIKKNHTCKFKCSSPSIFFQKIVASCTKITSSMYRKSQIENIETCPDFFYFFRSHNFKLFFTNLSVKHICSILRVIF